MVTGTWPFEYKDYDDSNFPGKLPGFSYEEYREGGGQALSGIGRPMSHINERSLLNYLKFKAGVEAAETVGKGVDWLIPNKDRQRERQLRQLNIIDKKKQLGLYVSHEDYQDAVNKQKPFENPGDSITMATSLFRHKSEPLLRLGTVAGALSRGRNVSRISKYFGL